MKNQNFFCTLFIGKKQKIQKIFLALFIGLFAFLDISCTSSKAARMIYPPLKVPVLPAVDSDYMLESLIEDPQTVYDLMQNSLIYEHQYYRYLDYSDILVDYINDYYQTLRMVNR